jgi:hypothetical protein
MASTSAVVLRSRALGELATAARVKRSGTEHKFNPYIGPPHAGPTWQWLLRRWRLGHVRQQVRGRAFVAGLSAAVELGRLLGLRPVR